MHGLRLVYEWDDNDVVRPLITASNGSFSASTRPYIGHDAIPKAVEILRGFPANAQDEREIEFGNLEATVKIAGKLMDAYISGARVRFYCIDRRGSVAMNVHIINDANEYARFDVAIEPAAIDRFVSELTRCKKCGDSAFLKAAQSSGR